MSEEHWKGIGKLIEECGEVLQIAGKAIPFPIGDHPDGQGAVRRRFEEEIGDLLAAIIYFQTINKLDEAFIIERKKN